MSNWEFLWVIFQRQHKWGPSVGDWYIELSDKKKIIGSENITTYLNELGSQGWEQVSSVGMPNSTDGNDSMHLFFKRQKQ